jgi:hypothetical protein
MTATTPTGWRQFDTKEARDAFADARARLDNLDFGEDGYTPERAAEDRRITDRYERLVLQPAQAEFEQLCDDAEFARHFPEPADGSRVEFEQDGVVYGAFRFEGGEGEEDADGRPLHWWLYGSNQPWSWRGLVFPASRSTWAT